jgi:hypothetical protein
LQAEQRFAPPDVIKCGGSVFAAILKSILGALHPPVVASAAVRAINNQIRKVQLEFLFSSVTRLLD